MNKLVIEVRTVQEDRVTLVVVLVTQHEVFTLGMHQWKIDEFMTLDKFLSDVLQASDKIDYRRDKWKEYLLKLLEELTA